MAPTPTLIAAVTFAVLLAGCTSNAPSSASSPTQTSGDPASTSTSSPTATSTPSPTPTWSDEQAAAVQAVDGYRAAIRPIAEDPASFSEARMREILKKVAGGKVVDANVGSYMSLRKRGFRYDGDPVAVSTKMSDVSRPSYGVEVFVTKCLDQREVRVLDTAGREVPEAELGYPVPDFNLRQYTVIMETGTNRFLVFGLASAKGQCGPG